MVGANDVGQGQTQKILVERPRLFGVATSPREVMEAVEETVALVSGCKSISLMLNKSEEPDSSYGYHGYYGKYEKPAKVH